MNCRRKSPAATANMVRSNRNEVETSFTIFRTTGMDFLPASCPNEHASARLPTSADTLVSNDIIGAAE